MRVALAVALSAVTLAWSAAIGQVNVPSGAGADSGLANDVQLALLQERVQFQNEFTSDILSTVYFTLGVTLAVLLAMIGFGWYQGHRVYERDKADLERTASEAATDAVKAATAEGEKALRERFEHFDANMARALESFQRSLGTQRMIQTADLFNAIHLPPTPRTDFIVLVSTLQQSIGKADDHALKHAVGVAITFLESRDSVDGATRTHIAELAQALPPSLAAQAARLTEVLQEKR